MDFTQNGQSTGSLLFFLLLLIFVIWMAKRGGFFRIPPPTSIPPITWVHILGAFLVYLSVAILLAPLLIALAAYMVSGSFIALDKLPSLWKGWGQLGGLCLLFLMLLLYCFMISPKARRFIFWGDGEVSKARFVKSVGIGLVGWIISYPFVLVSSIITNAIATWAWGESPFEQVAVKQLKLTMGNTPLFFSMIMVVVILVPFMEELLFRGLLQNFLKRYMRRSWSIAFTAIIFSAVHFAPSQGTGNFQLVLSLIALSGFLGFIYERERTLWAPITLHMTFNAINILAIIFAGG